MSSNSQRNSETEVPEASSVPTSDSQNCASTTSINAYANFSNSEHDSPPPINYDPSPTASSRSSSPGSDTRMKPPKNFIPLTLHVDSTCACTSPTRTPLRRYNLKRVPWAPENLIFTDELPRTFNITHFYSGLATSCRPLDGSNGIPDDVSAYAQIPLYNSHGKDVTHDENGNPISLKLLGSFRHYKFCYAGGIPVIESPFEIGESQKWHGMQYQQVVKGMQHVGIQITYFDFKAYLEECQVLDWDFQVRDREQKGPHFDASGVELRELRELSDSSESFLTQCHEVVDGVEGYGLGEDAYEDQKMESEMTLDGADDAHGSGDEDFGADDESVDVDYEFDEDGDIEFSKADSEETEEEAEEDGDGVNLESVHSRSSTVVNFNGRHFTAINANWNRRGRTQTPGFDDRHQTPVTDSRSTPDRGSATPIPDSGQTTPLYTNNQTSKSPTPSEYLYYPKDTNPRNHSRWWRVPTEPSDNASSLSSSNQAPKFKLKNIYVIWTPGNDLVCRVEDIIDFPATSLLNCGSGYLKHVFGVMNRRGWKDRFECYWEAVTE